MLLQPFQTRQHRRVLFRLILFCAECVVAEWVQADCLWLVGVEGFGDYGPVNLSAQSILCIESAMRFMMDVRLGALHGSDCDGGHGGGSISSPLIAEVYVLGLRLLRE